MIQGHCHAAQGLLEWEGDVERALDLNHDAGFLSASEFEGHGPGPGPVPELVTVTSRAASLSRRGPGGNGSGAGRSRVYRLTVTAVTAAAVTDSLIQILFSPGGSVPSSRSS